MKKCSKCFADKHEDDFYKDKSRADGLSYICKICRNNLTKEYFSKKPSMKVKYNQSSVSKWQSKNKEKCKKISNQSHKKAADSLSDAYVKSKIVRNGILKRDQITKEIVDAKKTHLKLLRAIKEKTE